MKNLKIIFLSLFCAAALVSCGTKPATYHKNTNSISLIDSIIEATTEIENSKTDTDESSILDDTSFETIIKTDSIEDKKENKSCETSTKIDNSSIVVETTATIVKNPKTTTSKIEVNVPASDVEETSSWIVVEKPIEETTTVTTIEENPNTEIDDYSYQLLAEIVWHEAGMDTIGIYDKAHIAAAVMNRVYDERFPNTVYENLIDQSQFPGFYVGTCTPTQECYDAVDYYLANPYNFDSSNSWFGDGNQNYFYYQ